MCKWICGEREENGRGELRRNENIIMNIKNVISIDIFWWIYEMDIKCNASLCVLRFVACFTMCIDLHVSIKIFKSPQLACLRILNDYKHCN